MFCISIFDKDIILGFIYTTFPSFRFDRSPLLVISFCRLLPDYCSNDVIVVYNIVIYHWIIITFRDIIFVSII